jgi:arylsulfatase
MPGGGAALLSRRGLLGAGLPAVLRRGRNRKPCILWLMTDEQRPDSLGCYGSRWAFTPHLDDLAAEGVLLESAYTPSPVCVPARSSLLTGRYGSSTGVLHNEARLPSDSQLLTWSFQDAGYQTASFGKKHYFFAGRQAFECEGGGATDDVVSAESYAKGYDSAARDALFYPDLPARKLRRRWILAGRFPAPREKSAEARNVNLALEWLERLDPSRPFLLRLSLNAPHTPVVAPSEFLARIDPDKIDLPFPAEVELAGKPERQRVHLRDFQGALCFTRAEIRRLRHYYYARAAFADEEIGRLLTAMRRRGLLDDTIVVFTSDHGTHLGDQGLVQKQTFYEQVATVPYLFWWRASLPRGKRLRTPVNTISLLPTLAGLAGVKLRVGHEAEDLSAAIAGGVEPPARPVFSEIQFGYQGYRDGDRQVMIRHGRWKLSRFSVGAPDGELYDLDADPRESANLFSRRPEVAERLWRTVQTWDRRRRNI